MTLGWRKTFSAPALMMPKPIDGEGLSEARDSVAISVTYAGGSCLYETLCLV